MNNCELCRLYEKREIKTHFYYENGKVIIVDCIDCRVPMIVWKEHKMKLAEDEIDYMLKIIEQIFGINVFIKREPRKIKDHAHFHIILK